jgi:putative NIF3 family GTP cyclohydrolase 1 type 2
MNAKEVLRRLTRAIPKSAEWSHGEPYGGYNIDSKSDIQKILYSVTPTNEVIEYFEEHEYDLLVSHHPFMTDVPQAIFHTALDCCEGGLNDQWRDALGVLDAKHFDGTLGWYGRIEPCSFKSLVKRCEAFIGHKVIGQTYSEIEQIESVVICSGLGGLVTDLARKTKADCYILGEATQSAESMGFKAVIEIGHTLSEQMGINVIKAALPELQVDCAPTPADRFGREVFRAA